ncbi:helix-turn-helix transcriptional regulator [Hymenobacter sp. BRD128]|uniref:helix-turn-helix domain-containing protein n=1 Tax=Hymenobacter sp. BRD128 TaxID=2675878 RepID=UPI0015669A32|nr:helix-turn-helix transcriptional regulator [Hymenobacter sp. BRD128]QKG56976.1 helix-turn-helix transcriptional regulator [Hymenobacter sp. BRD128]
MNKKKNTPEIIKELRQSAGLSQDALAEKLGMTRSAISLIESGKNGTREITLRAFAQVFGVSVHYLLTGEKENHTSHLALPAASPALIPMAVDYQALLSQAEEEFGRTPGAYCSRKAAIRAMELLTAQYRLVKTEEAVPRVIQGDTSYAKPAVSVLPSKQVAYVGDEWDAFLSWLGTLGVSTVSREQQADYIKRAVKLQAQKELSDTEKQQLKPSDLEKQPSEYIYFEVADSQVTSALPEEHWVISRLLTKRAEYEQDKLYTVVTHTGIFTRYLSVDEDAGYIMAYTYNPGNPPKRIMGSEILEVRIVILSSIVQN